MKQNNLRIKGQPLLEIFVVIAALSTGIAGFVHLYVPLVSEPKVLHHVPNAIFFLGSGIAQLLWIIPMLKRWGKAWYYVGIIGNIGFILLYIITRIPGNPITGRGGHIDNIDIICEFAQLAYILTTLVIIIKVNKLKIQNESINKI